MESCLYDTLSDNLHVRTVDIGSAYSTLVMDGMIDEGLISKNYEVSGAHLFDSITVIGEALVDSMN